jgi:hypothetical protein
VVTVVLSATRPALSTHLPEPQLSEDSEEDESDDDDEEDNNNCPMCTTAVW